jgi:hypothetical protein
VPERLPIKREVCFSGRKNALAKALRASSNHSKYTHQSIFDILLELLPLKKFSEDFSGEKWFILAGEG